MFNYMKAAVSYIFRGDDRVFDTMIDGVWDKAEYGKTKVTEDNVMARIIDSGENFILTDKTTDVVFGTYTRRRDAVRGAKRRGLAVAA